MNLQQTLRFGCFLLLILGVSLSSHAQFETATLSGRVADPQGAVVPGARVEVTNILTNISFVTETNSHGLYVVPNLRPGQYRIVVRKAGFNEVVRIDIKVYVQDVVVHNFSLNVGSLAQSVTVIAKGGRISTSPAVSTVIDRQFVKNLPLNGRSFHALLELTPGVVLTKASNSKRGQFSVNGQRANANYFMVDGVGANAGVSQRTLGEATGGSLPALSVFGSTSSLVSVDALEEFRVQTSTYAAEFGRTPGGQISISTRSGTNDFHGTVFEYFRNDKLDATDWFTNNRGLDNPPLRQSDFGGVLGGPIVKDRTFFFFSYEGLRLRQPKTGITTVPSVNARQIAPAAIQPLLNMFPVPTGPDDPVTETAEFAATWSDPSELNATSIRIDHVVSDKLTLFGRYNHAPSETDQRIDPLSTVSQIKAKTQTLTLGATLALTPTITNDFRANWSRTEGSAINFLDDFGGAVDPPDSALFPPFASREDSLFQFVVFSLPAVVLGPLADNVQRQLNLVDTFSLVRGSHQLKFGADYRRLTPIFKIPQYVLAPVFLDVPQALTGDTFIIVVQALETAFPEVTNVSVFAQDTWRATTRLTLTYGLRWEYNPPPTAANGQMPFALQNVDDPATVSVAPLGTPLWDATFDNFAPRVGAAYQLTEGGGTVLRGGFGLFYNLGTSMAFEGMIFGSPYQRGNRLFGLPWPPDPVLVAPPPLVFDPPFTLSVAGNDPNLELPYTAQWNLALEQSLGPNQTVSASYVGSVGRRLARLERLINPNPDFSSIQLNTNNATSDYHALQLQFQRRLSRGLQALANYTWSHSIDDASSDTSIAPDAVIGFDFDQERGSSDFDVRQSFTASVTYDIPSPASGGAGDAILGDWGIDTIIRASTGTPINILTGSSVGGVSSFARPDLVPGEPIWISDPTAPGGRRLNSAAFDRDTPIAEMRQGTLGRNALRGFGVSQVDLSLRREFHLAEQLNLQFRADFFNIFNHPNFGDPENRLNNSFFGQSIEMLGASLAGGSGAGFNPLYQVGGPRSIQIALKLIF